MKSYEAIGAEIGRLVEEKQKAYGDSFGKAGQILAILYPDGIKPGAFDDALAVVRVLDKLFRIATDKDALGESPWRDVAGYGLLGASRGRPARGLNREAWKCYECGHRAWLDQNATLPGCCDAPSYERVSW